MKKFVAIVCLFASSIGLAACAGEGNVETQAPYASDRTAGEETQGRVQRTYRRSQRK